MRRRVRMSWLRSGASSSNAQIMMTTPVTSYRSTPKYAVASNAARWSVASVLVLASGIAVLGNPARCPVQRATCRSGSDAAPGKKIDELDPLAARTVLRSARKYLACPHPATFGVDRLARPYAGRFRQAVVTKPVARAQCRQDSFANRHCQPYIEPLARKLHRDVDQNGDKQQAGSDPPKKCLPHFVPSALRLILEREEATRRSIGVRNCHLRFAALYPRPQTTQLLWFSNARRHVRL
jgi:hypothetical protein